MYVQAISAYAPHPNAAKLWMEFLYSRRGPEHLAEGLLQPDPLRRHGHGGRRSRREPRRPSCPTPTGAVLPTLDQITTATDADHQGLADDRRRHGQVGADVDRATVPNVSDSRDSPSTPEARHRRASGVCDFGWTWLGLVPFLALRDAVPAHPDRLPRRGQLPGQRTASSRSRTTPT